MSAESSAFSRLITGRTGHRFRIRFKDGEIYTLDDLCPISPEVYGVTGQWSGHVVAAEIAAEKQRFHRSGSGVDFSENDVAEIFDVTAGEQLMPSDSVAGE